MNQKNSNQSYFQFRYKNRVICLPFYQENYDHIVKDANEFRAFIDKCLEQFPQLFPPEIQNGYQLKDIRKPKKLPVFIRRILIKEINVSYTIRPSFVMPYLTAMTEEVERVLFRKYNVPFHALSYVFGANAMKWFRIEQNLGKNSLKPP